MEMIRPAPVGTKGFEIGDSQLSGIEHKRDSQASSDQNELIQHSPVENQNNEDGVQRKSWQRKTEDQRGSANDYQVLEQISSKHTEEDQSSSQE